jgi:hypothetical protein
VTVAAALASLTVFPQNFLFSMGLAGAVVALVAAALALVVLPAMLALPTCINALAPRSARRRPGRNQPKQASVPVITVRMRGQDHCHHRRTDCARSRSRRQFLPANASESPGSAGVSRRLRGTAQRISAGRTPLEVVVGARPIRAR